MIENSREAILEHENSYTYVHSRPKWVIGRVPALEDYRRISCDSMDELTKLAQIGQTMAEQVVPGTKLFFTQAVLVGAALLDRPTAKKLGLDFEKYRSVLMLCPTRFGKSFLNAFIAITNAAIGGKEVRIGGASRDKAAIIQEKIVELMPKTAKAIQDGLIVLKEEDVNKKVQRLATQVAKDALAWRNGGSIKLFSTNEAKKSSEVAAAGAVGVGGDIVILDEIQLMSPMGFRTASRFFMENENTKRFCVGNPQINGHFRDLYDDPNTFVVHINDSGAIIEGRMNRRQMELTGIPTYSNEYRAFVMTEFPPDNLGSRFFNTLPSIFDKAEFPEPMSVRYYMGIDSAYKGGDSLMVTILGVYQGESKTWARLVHQEDMKQKYPTWDDQYTTINIALDILKLREKYNVQSACLDIGLGVHIYEALRNLDDEFPVEPVHFNSAPTEWRVETDFNAKWALNARAEMHLDLKELCETGMFFIDEPYYEVLMKQMREIGNSPQGKKIKIESKADIKHRLGQSPDALDSLCLAVRAMVLSGALQGEADVDLDKMIYVS